MSKNLAWLLILIGGICEVAWVSGLKYADTLPLKALTGVGIAFSFTCAVLAMKRLEVSIVYSVFVGIGTGGVVIAEIVLFGEEASLIKIALISTLMLGVLGLKCSVKESKTAQDIHDHLPEELRIFVYKNLAIRNRILQWLQKKLNIGLLTQIPQRINNATLDFTFYCWGV